GTRVSLGLEPQAGVTVVDVLNDLDRLPSGRLMLPNLVAGMPVLVVARLSVAPADGEADLCHFRLAWDDPGQAGRQSAVVPLRLPGVPAPAWETLAPALEVQERATLLLLARLKSQAARRLEQG